MRLRQCVREFALVGVLAALAASGARAAVPDSNTNSICPTIAAEELCALMKTTQAVVVVNVMSKEHYDDCHIVGSICIPEIQVAETVKDWPRDRRIVVYCRDRECESSRIAARVLVHLGFTEIMMYEGGIVGWRAKGYKTEGPAKLVQDRQEGAR